MKYTKRGDGSLSLIRKSGPRGGFKLSLEYEDDLIEIAIDAADFGKMLADENHTAECRVYAALNAPEEDEV